MHTNNLKLFKKQMYLIYIMYFMLISVKCYVLYPSGISDLKSKLILKGERILATITGQVMIYPQFSEFLSTEVKIQVVFFLPLYLVK